MKNRNTQIKSCFLDILYQILYQNDFRLHGFLVAIVVADSN